nr:uncharacterized protein LOC129263042 [Lytechinus pictus]
MLAEYPAVVDFDFSPIPSPLFGKDDSFLPCYHGDIEKEVPLSHGLDPTFLNEDEDDVSSISASIQCSDTLEENEDLPLPSRGLFLSRHCDWAINQPGLSHSRPRGGCR